MTTALRFMTYNIKSGLQHPHGLEAVAAVIAAAEPDVVALQEVDDRTERSGRSDQTEWLRQRLGFESAVFGAATPWEGGGDYGLAILGRYPIVNHEVVRLYVPAPGDAPPPETEPRIALAARLALGARSLCVVSVHLGLSSAQRRRQTPQVVDFVRAFAGDAPCLIGGDFNAEPDDEEMRLVRGAFADALGDTSRAERISFPSRCLREQQGTGQAAIDYVFTTRGMPASAAVHPDDSCASDHDPVVADCRLDGARASGEKADAVEAI